MQYNDITLAELKAYFRNQTITINAFQLPTKVKKTIESCLKADLHNNHNIRVTFTEDTILYYIDFKNFLFKRKWFRKEVMELNENLTRIKYVNPF